MNLQELRKLSKAQKLMLFAEKAVTELLDPVGLVFTTTADLDRFVASAVPAEYLRTR